jgi:hypothetical protein
VSTGVEHYKRAQELLAAATTVADEHVLATLAMAQVHATLADAAATALALHGLGRMPEADRDAWFAAASESPGRKAAARAAELAEIEEARAEAREDMAAIGNEFTGHQS